ncbi:MAG: 5-formyltetrahydrofolate cyclo-ligase [Nanoarchaeota archaeon]|nr:5-formyltetrahydrofolate cyclo-ligase [Nanoarchaeota archaeon]
MKQRIREKALKLRNSTENQGEKSSKICQRLKQLKEFKEAKSVLLYWSIHSEVKTHELVNELIGKKEVYLPFTMKHTLGWASVTSTKDLKRGMFKILEPVRIQAGPPDLVVIPGVAYDEDGNRLGRGKGFYDRTLGEIDAPKIALAFESQIIGDVSSDHRDQPMDIIITEKRIIDCRMR